MVYQQAVEYRELPMFLGTDKPAAPIDADEDGVGNLTEEDAAKLLAELELDEAKATPVPSAPAVSEPITAAEAADAPPAEPAALAHAIDEAEAAPTPLERPAAMSKDDTPATSTKPAAPPTAVEAAPAADSKQAAS
jgi:hypothetical protein